MPEPSLVASRAICNGAFALLNSVEGLAGVGENERTHAWAEGDLPRWTVEWENEKIDARLGKEFECELTLYFIAHTKGDDAPAKADALRLLAQTKIMETRDLDGLVVTILPVGADTDRDGDGRAIIGSTRLAFLVKYDTDRNGVLI